MAAHDTLFAPLRLGPVTVPNRRDRYGGSVANRLRLTEEVVAAVRDAVGPGFVVGVRVSQGKVNGFTHQWEGGEADAARIFGTLGRLPVDYLHTTAFEAWKPAFGEAGDSLAALARRHAPVPVLANGSLHDVAQAERLVASGHADAISLGRGALAQADWPQRVRRGEALAPFDPAVLKPVADLANADRHAAVNTPA